MRHHNSVLHGLLKHVPWARFDELVDYLQARIDQTILGRRNRARGFSNYESFDEHQFAQMVAAS